MDERRGDWEKGVDENLAMLNSAQRSIDKDLEELDILTQKHERVILGDAEKHEIGVSAQVDAHEIQLNEQRAAIRAIRSTLFGDHAGSPGHDKRIERLEDKKATKERRDERREGYIWDFIKAFGLQLVTLAIVAVLNWERIETFAEKVWSHTHHTPAVAAAPAPKHKRRKKPKPPPPIVMPELNGESSSENVP